MPGADVNSNGLVGGGLDGLGRNKHDQVKIIKKNSICPCHSDTSFINPVLDL
jgi:hypothetical protein